MRLYFSLYAQVATEGLGARIGAHFRNGFILDLPDSFPGKAKTVPDIFQTHWMVDANAEKQA